MRRPRGLRSFWPAKKLRQTIAAKLDCDEGDLTLKEGTATVANKQTALTDLVGDVPMVVECAIEPGKTQKDMRQATFGSFFCEVHVNSVTGEVRLRQMHGSFAVGRILNLKTARSQCLGGMTFGIGMVLTEQLIQDTRDGHLVNHDLAEYHIPLSADVPQLTVNFIEERDPYANAMLAKSIGELGICVSGAAIVNAIYDATSVGVREMPATMDKILPGLPDV